MSLAPSSRFPLLSVRSGWHCAVACGVLPSTLELMVAPLALQMEFCESACTLGGWWGNGVCNFQNSLGSASRSAPQPQRGEDTGLWEGLEKTLQGGI